MDSNAIRKLTNDGLRILTSNKHHNENAHTQKYIYLQYTSKHMHLNNVYVLGKTEEVGGVNNI